MSPRSPLTDVVPADEELLLAESNGVVFGSAGNDFYPEVDVEVWDGIARPAAGEWDAVAEWEFVSPRGVIRVQALSGSPAGPNIALGDPGRWRLRAHCRGRMEAAARIETDLFYSGAEYWLVQLWPAATEVEG